MVGNGEDCQTVVQMNSKVKFLSIHLRAVQEMLDVAHAQACMVGPLSPSVSTRFLTRAQPRVGACVSVLREQHTLARILHACTHFTRMRTPECVGAAQPS